MNLSRSLLVAAVMSCTPSLFSQQAGHLEIGGGKIDITFSDTVTTLQRDLVLDWIKNSARAVITYHDHFPVAHVEIRVRLGAGHGASHGTTYGWKGSLIKVTAGRESTAADFADDWLLTHEMLHLAFPSVPESHHWIEEGLSTYVEPVARARAGIITPEKMWGEFVRDMPQGQPEAGDRGLDFTPTWGRTYWGGAIFCLLADVEIRKRTSNRLGLEHALRAIVKAGGTIEADWELEKAIEAGDKATGVPVLHDLYMKMRATSVQTDLEGLWRQLGIEHHDNHISFNDTAPLAAIRKAITAHPGVAPLPRP
ncbi:MAG: hypothetical protein JWO94_66 [Verrucomicrobiaceae bacterium]|nr:hypothetical protein [Verrucomicrobiaceae bacterium]